MEINKKQAEVILNLYDIIELVKKKLPSEQLDEIAKEIPPVPMFTTYTLRQELKEFVGN